jgi:GNAT superfamily N-acetyltransferase
MKRILAIDGGGIKGVFPAAFLARLEETLSINIAEYFDLIVGTSTGGILALALGKGLSAIRILEFYQVYGPLIFRRSLVRRILAPIFLGKYDAAPLRASLQSVFGQTKLGESKRRLVVPSTNLETGEVHLFKTAHHERFQVDSGRSMVDVALATAAAPTYFPVHRPDLGMPLIDGGIWANNPASVAVVEAVAVLGWERESLRVLSIGCTSTPLSVEWGRRFGLGMAYWGTKIVDVMLSGQSSASLGTAELLAGRHNIFRVSPVVAAGRFNLDATREVQSLGGLGTTEARKWLPALQPVFFQHLAEAFTASDQTATGLNRRNSAMPRLVRKRPSDCGDAELDGFESLVKKGGEVEANSLRNRILRAEWLVFVIEDDGTLAAVGALKRPNESYKQGVFRKARSSEDPNDFNYEAGWIFVEDAFRGRRYSLLLLQALVGAAGASRIYATTREKNDPMRRSNARCGFVQSGSAYPSEEGGYDLVLYTR